MVMIQEVDEGSKFIADLRKRFIDGEEIDTRVNYGFTCKREFGRSLKIQELNYENIPVVEERRMPDSDEACRQLKRRVISARRVRQIRGKRGGGRPQNWNMPPYTA